MSSIAAEIRRFVEDNLLFGEKATFADDASFLEQGLIDSTGVLELVAFVERTFGITLEDDELVPENLDSIANLVRFIATKQQSVGV